ncbi:MAG: LemA family protein [Clostridia bacterium]|nr:LemA family protein [Clostridia bacterium]
MWILISILIVIIIYIIVVYNKISKASLQVEQAKQSIDVYLKQRFDLIPNLVEVVKAQANYEKKILEALTKLRSRFNENNTLEQNQDLDDEYKQVLVNVEAYPELKTSEAYMKLQKQLTKMESQLQAARRIYNIEVTRYNTYLHKFPSNFVAGIFGFQEIKLYKLD